MITTQAKTKETPRNIGKVIYPSILSCRCIFLVVSGLGQSCPKDVNIVSQCPGAIQ
jgi:hypothetical protein